MSERIERIETYPTAGLDDVVHQRSRLGVLGILSQGDRVDFNYLRDVLDLTPGNLSRHLSMLVQAQLITIEKGYHGQRPRTWVTITRLGRRAYQNELSVLRSLLALADAAPVESSAAEVERAAVMTGRNSVLMTPGPERART